ncbi:MAG: GAF domain-containing protein [Cyanothece sp. SIO1E1]|nr:GAF domain-containing protein [Cyanothece sp. SIO1E1]
MDPLPQGNHLNSGSDGLTDDLSVFIYDAIEVGICVIDAEGLFVRVNPAYCRLYGYSPNELLGYPLTKVMPPEVHQAVIKMHQSFLEGRHDGRGEWPGLCKDGSLIQVEIKSGCISGYGGQQLRTITAIDNFAQKPAASETATEPEPYLQDGLSPQSDRENLMGAIAHRIRQSLELDEILNTTVAEVRQFLQADRVMIYRLDTTQVGILVAESVSPQWRLAGVAREAYETWSLDNFSTTHRPATREAITVADGENGYYQKQHIEVVENIEQQGYPTQLLALMHQLQVKAKLMVPILQGEHLWGVLGVHQCSSQRHWQLPEVELLKQLAVQVAIAIKQAELYEQVQQLNTGLERQVQQRTAELQQALEYESLLKRITDKVRDSLDESQIVQTAIQELGSTLGVGSCNAALYDLDQGTSTVSYEYTAFMPASQGRILQIENAPAIYQQLLQGQYFQYCTIIPNPARGKVAMLACPILDDQGVLGDLWLVNQPDYAFSELEIRLVQQVANQCAIAIRQARLYQASQAQVAELERLNYLKDDFLSTVSHELRTPVASIKMASQMLEVTLKRSGSLEIDPDKTARYLKILQDECDREIGLVNDLLDLSRLDAGNDPLNLTVINLQDWLSNLIKPFAERTQKQQQQLQITIPSDLPPFNSDLAKLERILTELLNNACKYTPPAGAICLTIHPQADKLQFNVSNSGVEISQLEQSRIFDKFYRIPNADPWKHGGTGLGLALVKRLVELLHGDIQVRSDDGWTTFSVQLPG